MASNRLGLKSVANILPDTSVAITISIPFLVAVKLDFCVFLGRANATITNPNAIIFNQNKNGRHFIIQDFLMDNPAVELIFMAGCWRLAILYCQNTAIGITNNNHKK